MARDYARRYARPWVPRHEYIQQFWKREKIDKWRKAKRERARDQTRERLRNLAKRTGGTHHCDYDADTVGCVTFDRKSKLRDARREKRQWKRLEEKRRRKERADELRYKYERFFHSDEHESAFGAAKGHRIPIVDRESGKIRGWRFYRSGREFRKAKLELWRNLTWNLYNGVFS